MTALGSHHGRSSLYPPTTSSSSTAPFRIPRHTLARRPSSGTSAAPAQRQQPLLVDTLLVAALVEVVAGDDGDGQGDDDAAHPRVRLAVLRRLPDFIVRHGRCFVPVPCCCRVRRRRPAAAEPSSWAGSSHASLRGLLFQLLLFLLLVS